MHDNKGKTWLDIMTLNQLVTMITILANHDAQWTQNEFIERMEDETEKAKYENYNDIIDPREKSKYAPAKKRFTDGKGMKRKFGMGIWNDEGKTLQKELSVIWGQAFCNKLFRGWIGLAWEKWVIDNKFCRHWKLKKGSQNVEVDMDDEIEQGNDQVGTELLLEGDEGFEMCRVGEWNRSDEEDEEQSVFIGSSLEESFQIQGVYEQGY